MGDWLLEPAGIVMMMVAAVVLFLMIWIGVLNSKLKKLRKNYLATMGETGITNLEDVVIELRKQIEDNRVYSERLHQRLAEVEAELPAMKSKVGVVRYNAFSEGGSDLSFSIALLSPKQDGVVFSGLHSRESTYVYAKPVAGGESNYPLTPEERKAIQEAK
ncbi:DUF4446 family protein [Paenibacillus sp. CAU 1782]